MVWVCLCHALNETAVNTAIAAASEDKLQPKHIHRQFGVKAQCGACQPLIQSLIDAARQTTTDIAAPPQRPIAMQRQPETPHDHPKR